MAEDILTLADRNMVDAFRVLAGSGPTPGVEETDELLMLSAGVPAPLFNPAFPKKARSDPAALVAAVVEHYSRLRSRSTSEKRWRQG